MQGKSSRRGIWHTCSTWDMQVKSRAIWNTCRHARQVICRATTSHITHMLTCTTGQVELLHVWVTSHVWMSQVAYMSQSFHAYEGVGTDGTHLSVSHVMHINESWMAWSCMSESCHANKWVINDWTHVCVSHVIQIIVSFVRIIGNNINQIWGGYD